METMSKKQIEQLLTEEGFKKVGFWKGLFFYERNTIEKINLAFNKGIKPSKLKPLNPDLYKLNGKDYLLITNNNLYIKECNG